MEHTCLNCNYVIAENFCSNCGQKKFKRIDKKYVSDELQYLLLHTNKGFLYTLKNLVKSPGKTARNFINGDRVNHYKPIMLAFLLSGISAFISFKIIGLNEVMKGFYDAQTMNSPFINDYMTFYQSYNAFIMLGLIPIFAFTTWLAFHKWKNNYYEHIVMNAYILSLQTAIIIVFVSPILFLLKNNTTYLNPVLTLSGLITPIVLVWFFKGYYPDKSWKQVIWRVLAVLGLMMVVFIVIMIVVMIGAFIYGYTQGPERMKYFLPAQP